MCTMLPAESLLDASAELHEKSHHTRLIRDPGRREVLHHDVPHFRSDGKQQFIRVTVELVRRAEFLHLGSLLQALMTRR